MTPRAILLPGSVLPAEPAYSSLIGALGSDADVVAKDLEVYATEEVPSGYDLDLEVAGVEHEAAARGWEQFHLVGYSGGGAAALARRSPSGAIVEPRALGAGLGGTLGSEPGRAVRQARVRPAREAPTR